MDWNSFIDEHLSKGALPVPARLQTALALLESLRENSSLMLADHLASAGSAGLIGHETLGKRAHERWNLQPLSRTHGRRSSHLPQWGQLLLDVLLADGFDPKNPAHTTALLDGAQKCIADRLRSLSESDPILVHVRNRSVPSIIGEVLRLAEVKGKSGDVAQYLVGAKLEARFGIELPLFPVNKADHTVRGSTESRRGDFEIGNSVIEVALGPPDDKHLEQIADAVESRETEFWLLTRSDRVPAWLNEVARREGLDKQRVVVTSVEKFVGQNISEMGRFETAATHEQLLKLFDYYNERWVKNLGTPGIRIQIR